MDAVLIHRIRVVDVHDCPNADFSIPRWARLPVGFVMLFTEDLEPIEPANFYLIDRYENPRRKRWQNTQKSYADDLANWWMYLHHQGIRWNEATTEHIKHYARVLLDGISSKTRCKFESRTIRRRVGTAINFHEWAYQEGFIQERIVAKPDRLLKAAETLRANVDTPPDAIDPTKLGLPQYRPDEKVNFLNKRSLIAILRNLGPSPYDPVGDDQRFLRNRLMAETSLYTGMRVEEVAALTIYQILDLEREIDERDPWKPIRLMLSITKGGKARPVYLPSFLVSALVKYIVGERAAVLEECEARGRFAKGRRRPNALFLNGINATNRDRGNPVSKETASRAFTAAVRATGLLRTVEGYELDDETGFPLICPDTGARIAIAIQVPAHTFHDLRHTFAIILYKSEVNRGNSSPWKKVQTRLGHARMSTTVDIYLNHVDFDEAEISDQYTQFVRRQDDGLDT